MAWAINGRTVGGPTWLTLRWEHPVDVSELVSYGRTAHRLAECWRDYEIYLDEDTPVAKGALRMMHGPQRMAIPRTKTDSIRILFMSSHGGQNPGLSELMVFAEPLSSEQFASLPYSPEPLPPGASGPNLLLFIADDVSVDDFGCYGHPHIRTPNIDRLAAQGMRFDNAYLVCSQCSPSRCSVLSGRYPHNHGAPELHMALPADQPMFARELKNAGYWCVQAGKWHMGNDAKKAFHKVWEGRDGGPGKEERWVQCLRERPMDRPFFAWFASTDAHRTWQPDAGAKPHTREDVVVPPYLVDTPETRDDLRQYYDEIQRYDRYIGLCVEELERQGVLDQTLILVMADNGRPFPRCKTRLFDSGLKTPFVVHYPEVMKLGQVCKSLVSSIDIAPTFLELAGLPVPSAVQGISFVPLLQDPDATVRRHVFGEHNWHDFTAHERMCRGGDFLYIKNNRPDLPASQPGLAMAQGGAYQSLKRGLAAQSLTVPQMETFIEPHPAEELYDVTKDYHQLTNLAGNPEHAETLRRMRQLLNTWAEQTGDTVPEDLTADVSDRHNNNKWLLIDKNGRRIMRPQRGTIPGSERHAERISHPGPR